ncbi:MAG: TrbI/VirB10 family protein [Gammaproteobacteria bacterium]
MASIFQKLGNMKTRALLVVVLVVIVIALVMVWAAIKASPTDLLNTGSANAKRIKPGMENLPGTGEASPVYNPLQVEENKRKAEEALKGSTSAVPTLVNPVGEEYGRGGFDLAGAGRCGDECYDEAGFDKEGFNRDGFDKNGFDKKGFDKNGLDKNGFDKNGFDKDGYDKNGFDKNGFDKNGFDKNGFDRFGYDKDGFDENGCNRQGFDRAGKPCKQVLGKDCFNQQGLDANGCNREGLGPDGKVCYNKDGFNAAGFDKCGFDKDGFSKDDRDRNGCDHLGKDKNGKACYDINGLTAAGIDKFGMDKNGFGPDGYDKNGFDKDGYDKNGFDKDGFDKNGCNHEGLNRAGKPCYDVKGYNDAGFDKQGYDANGYDKNGFDKQGFDKDGYDKDGFNRMGCNKEGLNRQGKPCVGPIGAETPNEFLAGLTPGVGMGTGGGTSSLDASQAAAADYQRLLAEQQNLDKQRNAELTAEQQAQALADQQARLEAYEAMMNTQAQAILQSWAPPTQVYVKGKAPVEVAPTPTVPGNVNGLPPAGQGPIIQKAGDMLFAVIDTSVNSDEPGPVLARVVSQGPLYGAKLMGTFERQDQVLFIRFSVISMPDIPQSIAVDAIAVDPETSRTSLATAVDNHTLEKYGTMLAASFLQGMGEAVETSLGTPQLDSSGSATIASQIPATTRDQVIVGLGKMGQTIGQELQAKNIQPTVTLDSGTGVGLLFMSDFRMEQPPKNDLNTPLRAEAPLAPGEAKPPATTPATGTPATGTPATGTPATGTPATGTPTTGTGGTLTSQSLTSGLGKPFTGL